MKLKTFNPETTPNVRVANATPHMSINLKSGVFSLNSALCTLLKVKHGDFVILHQDEAEPVDWFIQKVKSDGYTLRGKDGIEAPLCFNNTALSKIMLDCIEFPENTTNIKFRVTNEATEFEKDKIYGILLTSGICKTPNE